MRQSAVSLAGVQWKDKATNNVAGLSSDSAPTKSFETGTVMAKAGENPSSSGCVERGMVIVTESDDSTSSSVMETGAIFVRNSNDSASFSFTVLETEAVIVTDASDVQSAKAPTPIAVTLWGMATNFSDEQPSKTFIPIVVTLLGMVTEARFEHPRKAPCDISSLPSGNSTSVSDAQCANGRHVGNICMRLSDFFREVHTSQ